LKNKVRIELLRERKWIGKILYNPGTKFHAVAGPSSHQLVSLSDEILLKHLRSDVVLFISPNEKDHVVDAFVLRTLNAVYKNSYKDVSMHIREICRDKESILLSATLQPSF
jgi:hypothetical protein